MPLKCGWADVPVKCDLKNGPKPSGAFLDYHIIDG